VYGQYIKGLDAVPFGGLQQTTGLCAVQRLHLLSLEARLVHVLTHVAREKAPPLRLFERSVQDGMCVLHGSWGEALSSIERYIPCRCIAESFFSFTLPMAGTT
jgi:hypothetical protein